jgi:hypothetical protein
MKETDFFFLATSQPCPQKIESFPCFGTPFFGASHLPLGDGTLDTQLILVLMCHSDFAGQINHNDW